MITIKNKKIYKGAGYYIGRPSVLGNPFTVAEYGRGNCIELYRKYLWEEIQKPTSKVAKEIFDLAEITREKDLILVCWCSPNLCHGDVIKNCIEWINKNDKL